MAEIKISSSLSETERADRVAALVEEVLDLDPAARTDFLDQACGDDSKLRAEVESLLKFQKRATDFIEAPAYQLAAETFVGGEGALIPGEQLGLYKIISLLGEGGMGEVYLAQDAQLGRTVAIKLVKRIFGRAHLFRQFQQEERILAGLNHPNIAQLYGVAASDDGLPFFVMEYVEGDRLDDFCERQQLSIKARLEIFRKICAAVSYAHQNLVIHRDLKPGNIRVTAEGEPKLLDFGIAKLLGDAGDVPEQTMTFAAVMTPEYASPEQVRGERMTTASDVYSLGVILYELLTGEKPYRLTSRRPEEIARAITETVPSKPSGVPIDDRKAQSENRKLLRGDLDNIVLMAMRKEPERRYISVAQFSEDIRRHLAGLPVVARKDTWNYRSAKFVQRHKVGAIAALLLALTLLAGILTTAWQARRAEQQRKLAQDRFDQVRGIAHSLMFEVHDAIENLPGSTAARELIVKRALEYLDRLSSESSDEGGLQRELVAAYLKIGNVQGNATNPNLGDPDGAMQSYQKALAINEKLLAHSNETDLRASLALILRKVADMQAQTNHVAEGVRTAQKSVEIFRELATAAPEDFDAQMALAIGVLKLGDILGNLNFNNLGDQAGAIRSYEEALKIFLALEAKKPSDTKTRRHLGIIHERLGSMYEMQKDIPAELAEYEKSAAIRVPLAAEFPNDYQIVRDAAVAHEKMAHVQEAAGQFSEALESMDRCLEISLRLAEADPQNALAQQSLGIAYLHRADALAILHRDQEAIDTFHQAQEILRKNSKPSETFIRGFLQRISDGLQKLHATE